MRKAQTVVTVFEKVVTINGKSKRLLKSHFVRKIIPDEMQYQKTSTELVRSNDNQCFRRSMCYRRMG